MGGDGTVGYNKDLKVPIVVQSKWFTRQDIRNNTDKIYVWGSNLTGTGGKNNPKSGQAFACLDEPNCIGIPTKRKPSMAPDSFLTDADLLEMVPIYDKLFEQIEECLKVGLVVVWPGDGIGTGRAALRSYAPAIWNYLETLRTRLYKNYMAP